MALTGFYISKQDLETLLDYYKIQKPTSVKDRVFRGLIFRLEVFGEGLALFPDGLYSDKHINLPSDKDSEQLGNGEDPPSCPFPPGYPEGKLK